MMEETNCKSWYKVECTGSKIPKIKNHTATLVGDKILVFGGYDGRSNHNRVFEFDCKKLTWTQLKIGGQPPKGRNGHTATLCDNRIIIVGGWLGAGPLAASDLYVLDLTRMEWQKPVVTGQSPGPCNMHSSDYVPARRELFVFRGGDGRRYLNDLHLLNVDTYVWTEPVVSGQRPDRRANHSSALVDHNLFIFGGWDGTQRLNDIHVLDTRTLVWSSPKVNGHAPSPRAGMTLTCVRGYLYLFAGSGPQATCFNDLQIFDPKTFTWLSVSRTSNQHAGNDNSNSNNADDAAFNPSASSAPQQQSGLDPGNNGSGNGNNNTNQGGGTSRWHPKQEFDDDHIMNTGDETENPNLSSLKADIYITGSIPSERAGHTACLVGRKLVIFGGSLMERYMGDVHILDTDQAPQVKLNDHVSSCNRLRQLLPTYLNSPQFSDVTFVVEGQEIYAHKMILSLASEQFNRMFNVSSSGFSFKEAHEKRIEIPDVSYMAFQKTMEYLYTGTFDLIKAPGASTKSSTAQIIQSPDDNIVKVDRVTMNLLAEMLSVADRFMLDHLKQIVEQRMADFLSDETVDELLNEADMSNANQLRNCCLHHKRQKFHEKQQ